MDMSEFKELWDDFYRDGKYIQQYVGEPEIKFFGRLKKEICLKGLKALDFGCGVGRNFDFMEGLGLIAHGLEISEEANRICWMQGYRTQTYDGKHIPYGDNFFDIIISYGVLDHMLYSQAVELMNELHRVLKQGGRMLLVLHSIFDTNYNKGEEIENNTHIINYGIFEQGIPQHFYESKEIKKMIENKFTLERYTLHENLNFTKNAYIKDSFWELYLKK